MSEAQRERGKSLGDKAKARIAAARQRWAWFDHVMATQEHYSTVNGNVLAAGATYFGFLSFFPILALAFFVAGKVSMVYAEADEIVSEAVTSVLPGIIADEPAAGKITLEQIQDAANIAGVLGLLGVLYSGLGWLSGLRNALLIAYDVPQSKKPNFVLGKLSDLLTLALVGIVMVVSVGVSSLITGFADDILGWFGLTSWFGATLLWALSVTLGLFASTVLFYTIYRLLPKPDLPAGSIWRGALLGAIGFELLKFIVITVLGSVGGTPFAPLALAVTLVVWINYISRVTVYGAAWAYTDARALARRRERDRSLFMRPAATIIDERGLDDPAPTGTATTRLIGVLRPVAVVGLLVIGVRELLRRVGS